MLTLLGEKIKTLRKERGLTLEQLGEMTESSKSYIWALENKKPPRPSAGKISRIAEALGVSTEYLLNEELSTPSDELLDHAYFRKLQNLPPDTKQKIKDLIDMWGKEK